MPNPSQTAAVAALGLALTLADTRKARAFAPGEIKLYNEANETLAAFLNRNPGVLAELLGMSLVRAAQDRAAGRR